MSGRFFGELAGQGSAVSDGAATEDGRAFRREDGAAFCPALLPGWLGKGAIVALYGDFLHEQVLFFSGGLITRQRKTVVRGYRRTPVFAGWAVAVGRVAGSAMDRTEAGTERGGLLPLFDQVFRAACFIWQTL